MTKGKWVTFEDSKPLQATAKRLSQVVNFMLLSPLIEVFFEKKKKKYIFIYNIKMAFNPVVTSPLDSLTLEIPWLSGAISAAFFSHVLHLTSHQIFSTSFFSLIEYQKGPFLCLCQNVGEVQQ